MEGRGLWGLLHIAINATQAFMPEVSHCERNENRMKSHLLISNRIVSNQMQNKIANCFDALKCIPFAIVL